VKGLENLDHHNERSEPGAGRAHHEVERRNICESVRDEDPSPHPQVSDRERIFVLEDKAISHLELNHPRSEVRSG